MPIDVRAAILQQGGASYVSHCKRILQRGKPRPLIYETGICAVIKQQFHRGRIAYQLPIVKMRNRRVEWRQR